MLFQPSRLRLRLSSSSFFSGSSRQLSPLQQMPQVTAAEEMNARQYFPSP